MPDSLETSTAEKLGADIAAVHARYRELYFQEYAFRVQAQLDQLENEIAAMAAEALGLLGYEAVKRAIMGNTKGFYIQEAGRFSDLQGKMLAYIAKHHLSKSTAVDPEEDALSSDAGKAAMEVVGGE